MRLAIIGAGMAGLAAARTLRSAQPSIATTIYEKSRGVGGRVATRRVGGCSFDHGAQYMKAATHVLEQLLVTELAASRPLDISQPVWTFDGLGVVREGDQAQNAEAKWTFPAGLNSLGKGLASGLTVVNETRVAALRYHQGVYQLQDAAGATLGEAEAVLLTAPGPQTAEIIAASSLDAALKDGLLAELAMASYRRCLSLTFAYQRRPEVPWYALINTDRQHPISWLACEHVKPGRAPDDVGLLTAQMAHEWSLAHWDDAQAGTFESLELGPTYLAEVHGQMQQLVGQELGSPSWVNLQRWRYSLPDGAASFDTLNATGSGLYFAGDYTTGQGRIHLAIESGWRVAELIAATKR